MRKQVLDLTTNMTWLTVTVLLTTMISVVTSSSPRIDQHPTGLVVNMSDPVTLECRASGEPKPRITWYKDGQLLNLINGESTAMSSKYTLIHDSNLFIFSAAVGKGNRSDTGAYYCRAENEHGFANSQTAHLIVAYLKEDFREVPKSRQVNSGVSVSMECKAPKGFPEPLVTWERNGVPIQPSVLENNLRQKSNYQIFTNGSLVILNATLLDAGDYVCVAQNDAGFRYSTSATLSVFERPSFIVQPESSIKLPTQTRAEIKCQATGYPKPQIEWKKDNSVENLPIKAQITDANVLIIPNLNIDDEGEYTCVASNQLGSVESQTAYLLTFEKPVFTKHMSNRTVGIEGKSLTIECNARGRPQPVIYWAKSATSTQSSSATLMATQDDFIILENGNLFIEKLSPKYEGTYMCQASNEHGVTEAKTTLEVRPVQSKPPPLVIYWPQNQTIPINTQASLECFSASPGNIVVMGGVDMINLKEEKEGLPQQTERISVAWFKNGIKVDIDPLAGFDAKFRLLESGTLEINSVSKTDSGVYRCQATNAYGQTFSKAAFLNVENPNNQYVEFKRNFETTALPSAPPVQPFIRQITTKSVTLHWQPSSHSGHSPIRSYTVEYFSPEWPNQNGWITLAEDIVQTTYTVNSLQPDTYYIFVVRARNDQGYGPPSHPSDMIRTAYEPHHHHLSSNKQTMSEMLEKALTGEIVQLNEPVQVLSSSSVNITWKVLKSAYLIEGFYLKYKPVGSGKEYHVEKLKNKQHVTSHLITNLHKYTMYEFLVEPYAGEIRGSESNLVQCRTAEDMPSHAPVALQIEMNTLSSITIRWQPPTPNQLNGVLQGFKIICLANETRFNVNVNANASNRAILLGNLVENMRYCVRVAALTRVGIGPYTASKCVEMTSGNLELAKKRHEDKSVLIGAKNNGYFGFASNPIFNQMWFVSLLGVLAILGLSVMFYLVWCLLRRRRASFMRKGSHHHHHKKYLSSSEECSLNRNMQTKHDKLDQMGNRYKLVNDTVWLDTLHSNSNNSNPECCCVPDLHHQLYAKQNCSNMHLIHDLSGNHLSTMEKKRLHNLSIKSKYCTSHLVMAQQTEAANLAASLSSNGSDSGGGPQYAEIYAPLQNHPPPPPPPLVIQSTSTATSSAGSSCTSSAGGSGGGPNPYATTGLFLNNANTGMENSNGNFYNLLSNRSNNNVLLTLNDNSSSNNNNNINPNDPSNNLIKYIHRQTSQSNTPRMSTRSNHHQHHQIHHNVVPNVLDSNNCVIIQTEQGQNVLLATLSQPVQSATLRNYGGLTTAQHQQQNLIDEYITNAILAQNHQLHLVNSPPNLGNLIASSTLSRNGNQISSFTAQQYLNRSMNRKYQQSAAQQDYSSIGVDEEDDDQHHEGAVLLNANGLPTTHHQLIKSKNNNSISTSSYDESNRSPTSPGEQSTQSSGFSSSKRSSKSTDEDVKKRAMTTVTTTTGKSAQQHYANGDENDEDEDESKAISSKKNTELFISEMPQTIL